jgi:organic hydroperoxide reductase OsmC/OhrA
VQITARVQNSGSTHAASVATSGNLKSVAVAAKPGGGGSAVNGGEFLMLALATCYCNDLYREAARMNIEVTEVEVEASAEFAGVGLAASNVEYKARVVSSASAPQVAALLQQTDAVAEVHNTVRVGVPVQLVSW